MFARSLIPIVATLLLALACSSTPVRTDDDGVAIDGHDAVAYFTAEAVVEGSPAHRHQWRGAEWWFASSANRDRFADDPERYAPAYGGWCAWAMSEGRLAAGDPEYWAVHEDRLYLNCNQAAQDKWDADREGNIERANEYWPQIAGG